LYWSSSALTASGGTAGNDADFYWFEGTCGTICFSNSLRIGFFQSYGTYMTTVNSVSGGILNVTSTGNDPRSYGKYCFFAAATYKYIQIRYKVFQGLQGKLNIIIQNRRVLICSETQVVRANLTSDNHGILLP